MLRIIKQHFLITSRQLKFRQLAAFHNVVVTHCKYGDRLLPEVTLKLCFWCCVFLFINQKSEEIWN